MALSSKCAFTPGSRQGVPQFVGPARGPELLELVSDLAAAQASVPRVCVRDNGVGGGWRLGNQVQKAPAASGGASGWEWDGGSVELTEKKNMVVVCNSFKTNT
ncbi:hypothetical protein MRX96_008851 [Rhipicephalus microplus]